jgi:ribosomal protein S6
MDEKDKKEYEIAVLVKNEEDLASVVELVRQHNAEIGAGPHAKKIALAYEIKKNKEAVFAYYAFQATSEDVKNLEHDLNTKAEVIRSLIIASPATSGAGETPTTPLAAGAPMRRPRITRTSPVTPSESSRPSAPRPLSNEALEKKIEEILQ